MLRHEFRLFTIWYHDIVISASIWSVHSIEFWVLSGLALVTSRCWLGTIVGAVARWSFWVINTMYPAVKVAWVTDGYVFSGSHFSLGFTLHSCHGSRLTPKIRGWSGWNRNSFWLFWIGCLDRMRRLLWCLLILLVFQPKHVRYILLRPQGTVWTHEKEV